MSSSEVRRTANSNAKFGAAENARVLSASSCIQRAGLLQERHRAHQHRWPADNDRRADAQDQAHVVVEGQPRHDFCVRRRSVAVVVRSSRTAPAQVGDDIAVRDDHAGRRAGRARGVLQVRRPRGRGCRVPSRCGRVEVERVDLDDRAARLAAVAVCVRVDVADGRGGGEDDGSARSLAAPTKPVRRGCPSCGTDSGTAMKPACSAPRKAMM